MSFKIDELPKSASMEMSALAKQLKAEGKSIISLSIGDTHFPLINAVSEKIASAIQNNHTHYSNAQGELELRESIAEYYGFVYSPDEIVITHGVKNGMLGFLMAQPFKKVAVLEPAWLGYEGLCVMTEKEVQGINIYSPDFMRQIEQADFEALILCAPNNPDGTIFSAQQLENIYKICREKNAILMLDEIYKEYTYDGTVSNDLLYGKEGVVVFNGFSKSHAATGLRIGYFLSKDPAHISGVVKVQQNAITCPSVPTQHGFVKFENVSQEVATFRNYYQGNREVVKEVIPQLGIFEPAGGFYYFIDLQKLGVELTDVEFCKKALNEVGVALVPGSAYGKNLEHYVRLSFCIDREELKEGLNRLKTLING